MISKRITFSLLAVLVHLAAYSFLTHIAAAQNSYRTTAVDRLALLAIKSRVRDDPLQAAGVLTSWNDSSNISFCEWEGVTCSPRHKRVTLLNLSSRGLLGTLSPSIGNLSFLRVIRLQNNTFSGEIPAEIGRLFRLQELRLHNNSFQGNIPTAITNCTNLRVLHLGLNNLVGKIPDGIGSLSMLNKLIVHGNILEGGIPAFIWNLTSLDALSLGDCQLGGSIPDVFHRLTNLQRLAIPGNNLVGTIPPSLYNLSSLQQIFIDNNRLTGRLPANLGSIMPRLEVFSLPDNRLTGPLPPSILSSPVLAVLDVARNNLSGKLVITIRNSCSFDILSLSSNSFGTGEDDETKFIDDLSICRGLGVLDLGYNKLRGFLPESLGNLSARLYFLSVESNMFHGSLPPSICNIISLTLLDVSNNIFDGVIPGCFGNFSSLRYLNVNSNLIHGPFPPPICHMNNLVYLDMSNNNFGGVIPQCFGNISLRFLSLNVQSNLIQGPLPPSICRFSDLSRLDMSDNNLDGVIPECFGNITSLEMIDLGNNLFRGTIPDVYKNLCERLEGLILNGNKLQGQLPSSLFKCQQLKVLDVGNNHVSGTFPVWLPDLPRLLVLILKSNNLHGPIKTYNSTMANPFPSLRVLDLSGNGFVGHLPREYFQNFNSMKDVVRKSTEPQYLVLSGLFYSTKIVVKDSDLFFQKLLVDYIIIDLSNNRFEGEIPNIIGKLSSLKVLNLSHNNLNGPIPQAFGNLSEIESLDLSWNKLTGEIPQNLALIKGLAVLNFSQNHLMGRIPQGKQFNTFIGNSFGGNSGLCGFPLPRKCEHQSSPQVDGDGEDEEESGFTWKVVMMGYGFGTLLGLLMGYLMLSTGRPYWFNAIANAAERMILRRRNKRRYVYTRQ